MVWKISVKRISSASTRPPKYPAMPPIDRAERHRRRGREKPDEQRGTRAVQDFRRNVSPELVGAEEMLAERRLERLADQREGTSRVERRRGERDRDDCDQHDESRHRRPVACEARDEAAHRQRNSMRGSSSE